MRRRWLRQRPDGSTETTLQGGTPDGDGWAMVPVELTAIVGSHPDRFAPTPDGSVAPRMEVRLSVSTDRFRADGEDAALVMVVAHCEEAHGHEVALSVNGETVTLPVGEVLPIQSTLPGLYQVRIEDPRVYTRGPRERVTRAVEPGRYEEEREHGQTARNRRPVRPEAGTEGPSG